MPTAIQTLQPPLQPKAPHPLNPREREVLELIVAGHSNPEIALMLYMSQSTVKTHIRNIMNKLAVDNRVQVAVLALRLGWV